MPDFPETVGGWLLDLLGFVGLALGGSQAAASAALDALQQDAWHAATTGSDLVGVGGRRLSPAELAEMVVKGVIDQGEGAGEATYGGLRADRFDALVKMTGNPPGVAELITLWRRGIIDQPSLEIGIREGYTKNEWIPSLVQLRYEPLNVGEAVAAAVQNHLDYDAAAAIADKGGIDRADFDVLYANAGNPPGPIEILNLWNRGYVSEADVDQALRESRLKDKWIPALKKLAVHKIPMRTITTLLNHGALSDEQATARLRELGFSDEDAAAIVTSAHHTTASTHKQLSVAAIKDAYVERVITRDEAMTDLATAGYPANVADQLLTLADAHITTALRRAAITKIRSVYVAHKIDRTTASTDLDRLGLPAGQRDDMLTLWDLELEANVALLTVAQLLAADKRGLLSPDVVHGELRSRGYTDRDATILQMLHGSLPEAPV